MLLLNRIKCLFGLESKNGVFLTDYRKSSGGADFGKILEAKFRVLIVICLVSSLLKI